MKKNYRMIMRGFAAAGLVAGMAGSAAAQDEEGERRGSRGGGAPRGIMPALDLNADGKLDQNEIDMAVASLRKLDKNKDGELTADELFGMRRGGSDRPGGPANQGRRPGLAQLDRDGDGKISREEAPERMVERFAEIDTNGDGFIDKAEQEALMEVMRRRFQQEGGGQRPGQGRPQRDRGAGEGGADKPRRPESPGDE